MPSNNRIIICAAGGGKTTSIVREASDTQGSRCALITYAKNNEQEIHQKFHALRPVLPAHVEVMTWYTLLLRELARPYRSVLHRSRIEGLSWQEGRSVPYIGQAQTAAHYFYDDRLIYSDKIAKFVCECERLSGGKVMKRLAQRYDHIFIDEVQDLAGYDLEIVELIMKAGIKLTLVGDHRQATFRTNNAKLNSAFAGSKIIEKFRDWHKRGMAVLSYQQHTHRCHQHIASLGDSLFPNEPATRSLSEDNTGHDGVFCVAPGLVSEYVAAYSPQILRLDKKTGCDGYPAMNFGESKGMTFDRVLIFPHKAAVRWLETGKLTHIEKVAPKIYVGTTRARFSVAFVYEGLAVVPHSQMYSRC
jgi:DNA helicase II / ATP-dependent DNA helicase PcrA